MRRVLGFSAAAAVALGLFWATLPLAYAQETPATSTQAQDQLQAVQTALVDVGEKDKKLAQQEKKLAAQVDEVKAKLIRLAADIDTTAAQEAELDQRITDLELQIATKKAEIDKHRARLAELLAILQRLSLQPQATVMLSPTPPLDRRRAELQLAAIVPEIKKQADVVAAALADLATLSDEARQARDEVAKHRADLAIQQKEMTTLLAERTKLVKATQTERTTVKNRAATLARQAQNLSDLMSKLMAQESAKTKTAVSSADLLAAPAGRVSIPASLVGKMPVRGDVLVGFGQRDRLGELSKGVRLKPRAGALAIAPASGIVAFAGPFRGYGQMVILKNKGSFYTVVAGLESVNVDAGQKVSAGEPIGGIASSGDTGVYFELRQNGNPIDPLGQTGQAFLTGS